MKYPFNIEFQIWEMSWSPHLYKPVPHLYKHVPHLYKPVPHLYKPVPHLYVTVLQNHFLGLPNPPQA